MSAALRHPSHPALVHFPIACWILATLVDVATQLVALPPVAGVAWSALSHLLLWGGVLLALPAIVAGVIDYLRLPDEVQSSAVLNRHILAMATAWLLFLGAAIWRAQSAMFDAGPPWSITLLELAGSVVLTVGGRYAAAVVFEGMAAAGERRRD